MTTDVWPRLAEARDDRAIQQITRLVFREPLEIASPGDQLLVAEHEGVIAGYSVCSDVTDKTTLLLMLVVHPEFRRAKVATQLLEVIQAAAAISERGILAVANTLNMPYLSLLSSVGFRPVNRLGSLVNMFWGRRLWTPANAATGSTTQAQSSPSADGW